MSNDDRFKMTKQIEEDLLFLISDEGWEAIFSGDRIRAIREIRNSPRSPFGLKQAMNLADHLIAHFDPRPHRPL